MLRVCIFILLPDYEINEILPKCPHVSSEAGLNDLYFAELINVIKMDTLGK